METKKEMYENYAKMMAKAGFDPEFRANLKKDPLKTMEAELGEKMPDGFTVKIVEPDPQYSFTFLLPPERSSLSDSDMDNVAGGALNFSNILQHIRELVDPAFNLISDFFPSKK